MRILIISPMHSLFHSGGLGQTCERLSRELSQAGNTVITVIIDSDSQHWESVVIPNKYHVINISDYLIIFIPKIDRFDAGVTLSRNDIPSNLQQYHIRLKNIVEDYMPDVIISIYPIFIGYPAAMLASEFNIPLIQYFVGNDIAKSVFNPQAIPILEYCFRISTANVFLSSDMLRLAQNFAHKLNNPQVIYNGIEKSILEKEWRSLSIENPIFGSMGIFKPKKGIELFLEATEDLPEMADRIHLIGDFFKSTSMKGNYSTKFTGILPHGEALMQLDKIDVFVAPSLSDSCPHAVFEAMAAGRAIICSRVGMMADLLTHNESALIIERWTIAEMRKAILKLDNDFDLRVKIGHSAKTIANQYTIERERDLWINLINEVILNK